MSNPWYESQVIGVLVGAALGFLFAFLASRIQRWIDYQSFRKVLRAEIQMLIELTSVHRDNCQRCRTALDQDPVPLDDVRSQLNTLVLYWSPYTTAVFRNNLDKLLPFGEDTIRRLIHFYAVVDECERRVGLLKDVIPSFDKRDLSVLIATLQAAHDILVNAAEQGKKHSDELKPRWWARSLCR